MYKYRYSINFNYFNGYTFNSGNAGFYHDYFLKSKKRAEADLLKTIKKEYPAHTYNIYSCSEAYYIMKVKYSWSSCWRQFKRAFIVTAPAKKILKVLAGAPALTGIAEAFINWSLK